MGVVWYGRGLPILHARGFESLHLHLLYRGELVLSPIWQTCTTEAVKPDNFILRPSACSYKEGYADEGTRTARLTACESQEDKPQEVRGMVCGFCPLLRTRQKKPNPLSVRGCVAFFQAANRATRVSSTPAAKCWSLRSAPSITRSTSRPKRFSRSSFKPK